MYHSTLPLFLALFSFSAAQRESSTASSSSAAAAATPQIPTPASAIAYNCTFTPYRSKAVHSFSGGCPRELYYNVENVELHVFYNSTTSHKNASQATLILTLGSRTKNASVLATLSRQNFTRPSDGDAVQRVSFNISTSAFTLPPTQSPKDVFNASLQLVIYDFAANIPSPFISSFNMQDMTILPVELDVTPTTTSTSTGPTVNLQPSPTAKSNAVSALSGTAASLISLALLLAL
ncbi:hypothetical protein HDV03_002282 [Kappamyces sp. JEL0829]|nr:hypothetical protein HDV03_002282 [Kappamyces sp. JEL0829]